MLIDLERNDLGRVCRPGTVEVNELMVVETYAHVHHIVSNVRGQLVAGGEPGRCDEGRLSGWYHYRLSEGALHADHC